MSDIPQVDFGAAPKHRVKLDLTINVPTIMTLVAMTVTIVVSGIRVYNDLDGRTTKNAYELQTLRDRVVAAETSVSTLKNETNASSTALRSEIKQDLSEIKNTLNDLVLGRRTNTATLRNWSR